MVYQLGVRQQAADALARLLTAGVNNTGLKERILVVVKTETRSYNKTKIIVSQQKHNEVILINKARERNMELSRLSELIIFQCTDQLCEQS